MKKVFVTAIAVMLLSTIISCESKADVYFTIAPTSYDFGQVNIGTLATLDFVVTNKKSVDMTLTMVGFTSGDFSEITGAQGQVIKAKETLTITVRFVPTLPGGEKLDTMTVEWTDVKGKKGKKNVKLSGVSNPVPLINLPVTDYDFGTVGIGQTATLDCYIENTGKADLLLSNFNFIGNETLFSITAGGTVPVRVIPGATHNVTVQFAPVATGDFPTVLEITHNAVNAVPPEQINIAAAGNGGRIETNQTSPWDFGTVRQNSSRIDVIEISNVGSTNLNIQSITLVNGNEFTLDSVEDSSGNPIAAPFAIAPSDFVEVTIKFSPTDVQQYQGTLKIKNDGPYESSPAQLQLRGSGRAPITQSFNYTGAAENWNVPAGVGQIDVELYGAEGGQDCQYLSTPGKGGKVVAGFTVQPGAALGVYVGGKGGNSYDNNNVGGIGGWNGGGTGGESAGYYGGGGGGGASDIRRGGSALADRFVVAGGAGGSARWTLPNFENGGDGGGLEGENGYFFFQHSTANTTQECGKGGTQSAGGAGGTFPDPVYGPGDPGTLGTGGNGAITSGGGAGGGGYYGGGAGSWAGGGGGSSFTANGANNVTQTQGGRSGDGQISIIY